MTPDEWAAFKTICDDPELRLKTLYRIVDKEANEIQFIPNGPQSKFLKNCGRRDLILKARQKGFTTLACLLGLDDCLFNENFRSGIIAHSLDDAKVIFDTKIKFAYDHLPEELKLAVSATTDRTGALKFSNGSFISVSTSFRSGTLNRLHVSEFGKICAKNPEKAREIITGAFPAAEKGIITIESTAEGQDGPFYEMTMAAMALHYHSEKDFRFHFFPWWDDDGDNFLNDSLMALTTSTVEYFDKLEHLEGIRTTRDQRCWYQMEQKVLGADMKRENPSTPREAFEQALEGSYFEAQLLHANKTGSIGRYPLDRRYPVNTFWDLGRNDYNTIWLHQDVNGRNRFIGYYENSGEDISHYIHWLRDWAKENKAKYDNHYLPHDGNRQSIWLPEGTLAVMSELGFYPKIVPRVRDITVAINVARGKFASCDFDEQGCELGLKRLRMYRKEFDETRGVWRDRPRHDKASHGASAFLTFATGFVEAEEYEEEEYDDSYGRSATTGY